MTCFGPVNALSKPNPTQYLVCVHTCYGQARFRGINTDFHFISGVFRGGLFESGTHAETQQLMFNTASPFRGFMLLLGRMLLLFGTSNSISLWWTGMADFRQTYCLPAPLKHRLITYTWLAVYVCLP